MIKAYKRKRIKNKVKNIKHYLQDEQTKKELKKDVNDYKKGKY